MTRLGTLSLNISNEIKSQNSLLSDLEQKIDGATVSSALGHTCPLFCPSLLLSSLLRLANSVISPVVIIILCMKVGLSSHLISSRLISSSLKTQGKRREPGSEDERVSKKQRKLKILDDRSCPSRRISHPHHSRGGNMNIVLCIKIESCVYLSFFFPVCLSF